MQMLQKFNSCTNQFDTYSKALSMNVIHDNGLHIYCILYAAHCTLLIIKIIFYNLKYINCYKNAEFWNIDKDRRCAHLLFECMNIWVSDVCAIEKKKKKTFLQIFIVYGFWSDKLPACSVHCMYTLYICVRSMFNVQCSVCSFVNYSYLCRRCQTLPNWITYKLNYQL